MAKGINRKEYAAVVLVDYDIPLVSVTPCGVCRIGSGILFEACCLPIMSWLDRPEAGCAIWTEEKDS